MRLGLARISYLSTRTGHGPPAFSCALLACTMLLANAGTSTAQEHWTASRAAGMPDRPEIVEETRHPASGGLPDGLVAVFAGDGDIAAAWYSEPTDRYGHGVLGDAIEAATLVVRTAAGTELALGLPETEVFEDRYPRLADLDGDGRIEVVTIRSSTSLGAAVTVYGLDGDRLRELASTGFIGRANRWLNIAGIADFRGTGARDIAYVRTPHIGGTLFVHEYAAGALVQVGALDGFSNHAIGARELRLSAVADVNGDGRMDLALPSDDRRTLRIVGFVDGALREIGSAALPSRIDGAIAVGGTGRDARFIVGLESGEAWEVHR